MSRPPSRAGFRRFFSPAFLILLAGLATFALTFWLRSRGPALSELEAIIAANAPQESVTHLAAARDGKLYVATSLGLIAGRAGGPWERVPEVQGPVRAAAPASGGSVYVAGPELGVSALEGGRLRQLHRGDVTVLALDPDDARHLIAYDLSTGLIESRDGGQTWAGLGEFGRAQVLALAVAPGAGGMIAIGGTDGLLAVSEDGGHTWDFRVPPHTTVSALAFDPAGSGRLWAAAGGRIFYSEDRGGSWRQVRMGPEERIVIGLTPVTDGGRVRILAATPEGYLFSVAD